MTVLVVNAQSYFDFGLFEMGGCWCGSGNLFCDLLSRRLGPQVGTYVTVVQTNTNSPDVGSNPFGRVIYFVETRASVSESACNLVYENCPGEAPGFGEY